ILGDRADRTILLNQAVNDVVEWLKHRLVYPDVPVAMRHNVVASAGLRFGGSGELVLLALRGDEVDMNVDFVLRAPLVAELDQRFVSAGHPVVPNAQGERAGSVSTAHVRCRDNSG